MRGEITEYYFYQNLSIYYYHIQTCPGKLLKPKSEQSYCNPKILNLATKNKIGKNTYLLSAFNVKEKNKKEDTLFWTVIELQFMPKQDWLKNIFQS